MASTAPRCYSNTFGPGSHRIRLAPLELFQPSPQRTTGFLPSFAFGNPNDLLDVVVWRGTVKLGAYLSRRKLNRRPWCSADHSLFRKCAPIST